MRLVPETSSLGRWLVLAPLSLMVAAALVARLAPDRLLAAVHCPLRDLTGAACPTCGGTHALVALAAGRLAESWRLNPAVPVGAMLVAGWALWSTSAACWPRLRVRPALSDREKQAARWLAACLFLGLWLRQCVALS